MNNKGNKPKLGISKRHYEDLDGLQDPIEEDVLESSLEVSVESGTTYYWRVKTSDGKSSSFTLVYSFIVN